MQSAWSLWQFQHKLQENNEITATEYLANLEENVESIRIISDKIENINFILNSHHPRNTTQGFTGPYTYHEI